MHKTCKVEISTLYLYRNHFLTNKNNLMLNSTTSQTDPALSIFEVYSESPFFITFKADNAAEKVEFIEVDKSTLYAILDGFAPLEEDGDWLERVEEDTLLGAAQTAVSHNWRYKIISFTPLTRPVPFIHNPAKTMRIETRFEVYISSHLYKILPPLKRGEFFADGVLNPYAKPKYNKLAPQQA